MLLEDDFLLETQWGKKLFHNYAKKMPIIDYHCHLEPKEIYENKNYDNLTKIWLNDNGIGDHYKWRLLRAYGTEEKYITGDGDDYTKFFEFVKTVEKAIGNPIYEWSHLELKRYFDIDLTINAKNAKIIWDTANDLLAKDEFRPRQLIQKMNVHLVATTDDPISNLDYHKLLKKEEDKNGFKVVPTFRPDMIMDITNPNYLPYMEQLGKVSGISIRSFEDLEEALAKRVQYFHEVGGRLSDHGLNTFYFKRTTRKEVEDIFNHRLHNSSLNNEDVIKYQSAIQIYLMSLYVKYNWTMQLHMNAFRNNSERSLKTIGVNAGFDSMGDQSTLAREVVKLLNEAELQNVIPKTILYSLNPNDWLTLSTLMGSFQGGMRQKIHLGCAWWFNDTREGMKTQLTTYAQQSLLANFIGMLTDSRSFLSYPRHEYFRRVLCDLIGKWVERGQVPEDEQYLGQIIEDICYNNAYEYFGFFA
ncbi:glucuronate isomerase [Caldifermentibacillus hisashii]|uniref:glucuronate isomerase n=1 Tax=Caldifermentibacillus hisashii TaxID=996558 RepID=UPI0031B7829B